MPDKAPSDSRPGFPRRLLPQELFPSRADVRAVLARAAAGTVGRKHQILDGQGQVWGDHAAAAETNLRRQRIARVGLDAVQILLERFSPTGQAAGEFATPAVYQSHIAPVILRIPAEAVVI